MKPAVNDTLVVSGALHSPGIEGRFSGQMKAENPIEEVWRIREEIAAENGYDVDRLFDAMLREQEKYAGRLVHQVPRCTPGEAAPAMLREEPPKNG